MLTISQQAEKVREQANRIEVLKDDHAQWLANKVTKRFQLEMQCVLLETLDESLAIDTSDTVGNIAIDATYRRGVADAIESIIRWEPEDF